MNKNNNNKDIKQLFEKIMNAYNDNLKKSFGYPNWWPQSPLLLSKVDKATAQELLPLIEALPEHDKEVGWHGFSEHFPSGVYVLSKKVKEEEIKDLISVKTFYESSEKYLDTLSQVINELKEIIGENKEYRERERERERESKKCCNCKLEVKNSTFVKPSFIVDNDVFSKNKNEEIEGKGWYFCDDCFTKIFKCWVCGKGNCFSSSNQRYCVKEKGEFEYICNSCSGCSGSGHSSILSETEPTSGILYHLKKHRETCEICRKECEKNQEEFDKKNSFNCKECNKRAYKCLKGGFCSKSCLMAT